MRTFIALELPQELIAQVKEVQEQLKDAIAGVKWVTPQGVHLTLKFLGEISEDMVKQVEKVVQPVTQGYPPFLLRIKGVGGFPDLRRPRVIFLGVEQGALEVKALEEGLARALEGIGFPREKRPFSGHFTFGRVKEGKAGRELAEKLAPYQEFQLEPFMVGAVTLFKSELRPSGAIYTRLNQFPLGGGGDDRGYQ